MASEQKVEVKGEKGKYKIKTQSILEDYEVAWNQKLGTGISGPVRPCRNKTTKEQFALKCLYDKPRARQEISLHLKCCGNPQIVQIYDVYANEVQFPGEPQPRSRLLVVMELMNGGELFDRISKQKYFTEVQAANYTKQIVMAIERCHSLNIAHRDIKPENLLLKDNSEDAFVKLSDFGFAKVDEGNLTTPHFTPYYVAPQVLQAQKEQTKNKYSIIASKVPFTYDKSCDMWSLGVIIYIMLCGYPPFYSETPSKQITRTMKKKILAGHYEFPQEDWSHVSLKAKDLVARLLKVNPEERLSVYDVLNHPWLSEAPLTQLQSPAVLLDKTMVQETQAAHSEQLTAMRIPDSRIKLKPLTQVNNPMLKKRLHPKQSLNKPRQNSYEPPAKQASRAASCSPEVRTLRDVIAHCILPPSGANEHALATLVTTACSHHRNNAQLDRILQQWQWQDNSFKDKPDLPVLAQQLSKLVQKIQRSDSNCSEDSSSKSSNKSTQHALQHLQISSESQSISSSSSQCTDGEHNS